MKRIRTRLTVALLTAAVLPLAASGALVWVFIDRTLDLGFNPEIESELSYSLDLAKRLHRTLKSQWELTVASLSDEETLMGYPDVEGVVHYDEKGRCHFSQPAIVLDPNQCPDELFEETAAGVEPLFPVAADDPDRMDRIWVWQTEFPGYLRAVSVRIDGSHRIRFLQSLSLLKTYRHVETLRSQIIRASMIVYLSLLTIVALFAFLIGRRLSRRVTEKLDGLLVGTEEIARGNLQHRVEAEGNDELARLSDSFNRMVRDIDEGRARIVFLEKTALWQDMARKLAHQIKNPLTPIGLAIQQIRDSYKGEDEAYRNLLEKGATIVAEETDSLKKLVESFSAFAKMPKSEPQPEDLGRFLKSQVDRYPEINDRLEIQLTVQPDLPSVSLDVALMKGAFYNLLENAAQASERVREGKGKLQVTAEIHPERRDRVRVTLQDDGPGMDAHAVQRLFEPYYTTKPTGTGLGLAVTRKTIIEHGGDIQVRSAPGEGATFTIELPVAPTPVRK